MNLVFVCLAGGGEGDGGAGGGTGDLVVDGVSEARGRRGGSVVGVAPLVVVVVREEMRGGKEGGWAASVVKSDRTPQSSQSVPTWQELYSEPRPPSSQ